jgi:hypothetical protein
VGPFLVAGAAVVAYLLVGTYVLPWYLAWGLPVLAVVWRWRVGWLVMVQAAVLQLATARVPTSAAGDPLSVGSSVGRFQLDLYTLGVPLMEVALVVVVIVAVLRRPVGPRRGDGRDQPWSSSATSKARSMDWWALRRGSHMVV